MSQVIERGVLIEEVKRRSAVGRDIDAMEAGVASALGLER